MSKLRLLALCLPSLALAGPITVPPAVTPGSTYRLIFVTAGTIQATSPDIATYNAFVTAQANSNAALAALNTTWSAIGSTDTVSALDNIGGTDSTEIYNLAGTLIADGTFGANHSLFGPPGGCGGNPGGCGGTIYAAVRWDQNGNDNGLFPWNGTAQGNGQEINFGTPLGLGDSTSVYGNADSVNNWAGWNSESTTSSRSVYAISGDIVFDPVPEPSTLTLLIGAGCVLAGSRRTWNFARGFGLLSKLAPTRR
jgi:hypothetical protein